MFPEKGKPLSLILAYVLGLYEILKNSTACGSIDKAHSRKSREKIGKYVNVKISSQHFPRLDVISRRLGYKNRDEVVNDAVRRFIETIDV